MAFTSVIKGMTAGVGGMKRIFGTWDSAAATTGTITWDPGKVYNPIGCGACYSTAVTTVGLPDTKLTAGTLVLTTTDSGAAGYWWVDVQ